MGQKVTIGGNRLGSGKKMHTELDNYGRSSHNLSEVFTSSMGCGILYPCFKKLALRGDKFVINMDADCRTIPTKGPLFGSYKMQIDFFECPIRLYQALLHNNPTKLGLKMNQVKLPMLKIGTGKKAGTAEFDYIEGKFSNSSLLKYLGMSGLGTIAKTHTQDTFAYRYINAIPALAYYDIFKNYYANKQEDYAYVIIGQNKIENAFHLVTNSLGFGSFIEYGDSTNREAIQRNPNNPEETNVYTIDNATMFQIAAFADAGYPGFDEDPEYINDYVKITLFKANGLPIGEYTIGEMLQKSSGISERDSGPESGGIYSQIDITLDEQEKPTWKIDGAYVKAFKLKINYEIIVPDNIGLEPFPLASIDDMRYSILSHHTLGSAFTIDNTNDYPYLALTSVDANGRTLNAMPLTGLVLKTYQNDIFNNWINTEWIDGPNGINELSKVEVVDGAFSMDALNFATKIYMMMNRVALTDGTYDDWQDVIYEEMEKDHIESPVYLGGMSKEIVFDEVIQTAPAEEGILGTLGGRGIASAKSRKGGHIVVKCREACYIIGIVSLTPRIMYTQGNDFDMTELQSVDDFHKPGMDGIGFQDLLGERMAYWDTQFKGDGVIVTRNTIGKLPAWIEYMTSVNKAYGDFADTEGKGGGYMVLNRNYERDEVSGGIKDATTYIDPSKYNYAFGYDALDSQNFWVQIAFEVIARRKMSARIMPNV